MNSSLLRAIPGAMLGAVLGLQAAGPAAADEVAEGKKIANDRLLGNCVACHLMAGSESPGTIGPPLVAMQTRYASREKLRAQIWDATQANPLTPMPPFGRHGIMTEEQIDRLTAFIWTL